MLGREFDQRAADFDQLAGGAVQPGDVAADRRGHFDHRFVGLDRNERLVGDDMITFTDMPRDDLGFVQSFTEIGHWKYVHARLLSQA